MRPVGFWLCGLLSVVTCTYLHAQVTDTFKGSCRAVSGNNSGKLFRVKTISEGYEITPGLECPIDFDITALGEALTFVDGQRVKNVIIDSVDLVSRPKTVTVTRDGDKLHIIAPPNFVGTDTMVLDIKGSYSGVSGGTRVTFRFEPAN